ncbi:MAG: hypothetical protein PHC53_02390 [Patescibacteria group bacterium]|nr:hypothetical protein [Patescibacteria group bacterium]
MSPQEQLLEAYARTDGNVAFDYFSLRLQREYGLTRELNCAEDLKTLNDDQAIAALKVLKDYTIPSAGHGLALCFLRR